MPKNVAAIVCAAGPGTRFGGKRKKQFVDVNGRAVFVRSIELFANRDDVRQVLLGISKEDEEIVDVKWGANLKFFGVKTFFGGGERFDTIRTALELLGDDIDLIAVHDACRCCATEQLVSEVIAAAARSGAAIPACPVTATLKEAKDGVIARTVDRANLVEAQTPQVFEAALLRKAYDNLANLDPAQVTDDAFLVEALGHEVSIVRTDSSNIKITVPSDVPIAEAILKSRPKPKPEGPIGPYIEAQW
ncbi:2-C-methyl-D-erythritol 4-phosphate cytidylyltransferase [Anaerobaca lacustris]|uniref:2-C-methyl-D-erythritol 4-phosphate cytidylyltransferase n=1 Tax=Anaerobaca lacustris TaxID=3044600 RepID=A0AAW6U1K0_9BACT|nr:2-C-methyl-D-erythritol 4-phosphate cytidylyltransferase [Sedimentisphaerales bacterium M17dextr]